MARLSSLGSAQTHREPVSRKPVAWAALPCFRAAFPRCSSRCRPELRVCCDFREHNACKSLFSSIISEGTPDVAVVPVVVVTALASRNPHEPASRTSPDSCSLYLTRYKDDCFLYSCEKWEQAEAYEVHTSSLPFAPSFFRSPPSADRNTAWCFISELFPAAACKNCLCFSVVRH